MTQYLRRRSRSERGVTAVLVAISLTALCGVGALAVDLGNAWQTRRSLVTAADAAALAAAQQYATGGTTGCPTVAADYAQRNAPGATVSLCQKTGTASAGRVTVQVQQSVNYLLGGVVGLSSGTARGTTTAHWGSPTGVTGARPLALCVYGETEVTQWLANPSQSDVIEVLYDKDNTAACNGDANVPGNWGLVDYDGGSNPTGDQLDWIENGYPGEVRSGTPTGNCTTEPRACFSGDPGAFSNSLDSAFDSLESSGEWFVMPFFDKATGSGNNTVFHFVGFARARLIDHQTTGANGSRSLTLEFQAGLVQGPCCGTSGVNTGLRVVEICAVDPNVTTGC
jgi:Flp pilus assembly protein TadG